MTSCYASITGTTVIQLKDVPMRPEAYDGKIELFNLPVELLDERELRAHLAAGGGEVQSCQINVVDRKAVVQFATHKQAKTAITSLTQQERAACTVWNDRKYDGFQGRGWVSLPCLKFTLLAAAFVIVFDSMLT